MATLLLNSSVHSNTATLVVLPHFPFIFFCAPTELISAYQAYWLINQLQPSLRAHTAKEKHRQRKLNTVLAYLFSFWQANIII